MNLKQALLDGKRITSDMLPSIFENMATPDGYMLQYNVSPSWLLHSEYFVTDYDGRKLIYKAKPFLNFIIFQIEMLPFPMDYTKVYVDGFLEDAKALGVQVRVTAQDVDLFDLDRSEFKTVDAYGGDFVYSISNNLSTEGKDNEQLRLGINRIRKNPDITVEWIRPEVYKSHIKADLLKFLKDYEAYKRSTGNKSMFTFHLTAYVETFGQYSDAVMQLIKYKGVIKAFSITERMNSTNISMIDRKSMLHEVDKQQQSFRAMNWFDIEYWSGVGVFIPDDIFFNFGSSGDAKALYETKRRMNPHEILKVYKFKDTPALDEDLAKFAKPEKPKRKKLW